MSFLENTNFYMGNKNISKKRRYLHTIFKYLEFRHPYSKEMDGNGEFVFNL